MDAQVGGCREQGGSGSNVAFLEFVEVSCRADDDLQGPAADLQGVLHTVVLEGDQHVAFSLFPERRVCRPQEREQGADIGCGAVGVDHRELGLAPQGPPGGRAVREAGGESVAQGVQTDAHASCSLSRAMMPAMSSWCVHTASAWVLLAPRSMTPVYRIERAP